MEEPVYVISPHLDDGVLSCGQLLANRPGSTVITVFAGAPHRRVRTPYDHGCGFASSQRAVLARRAEDANACGALNVRFTHLGLLDGQYRTEPICEELIAATLRQAVSNGDAAVFAPVGINHSDHEAVCDAALAAGFRDLWLYEELPARVLYPELAAARVAVIAERGVELEFTTRVSGDVTVKGNAVRCYVSQIHDRGSLGNEHTWLVPERYWRVVR